MTDGQTAIDCTITESKSLKATQKFVKVIHSEELELPPNRPAGQEVQITYSYDENQIVHATFKDVASGLAKEISISLGGDQTNGSGIDKFLVD